MYYDRGSRCPILNFDRGWLMQFAMVPRLQKDKTLKQNIMFSLHSQYESQRDVL